MARVADEVSSNYWVEAPEGDEELGAPLLISGWHRQGRWRFNGCVGHVVSVADIAQGGRVLLKLPEIFGGINLEVPRECLCRLSMDTPVRVRDGPFGDEYARFMPEKFAGQQGLVIGWDRKNPVYCVRLRDSGLMVELPSICLYAYSCIWEFDFAVPEQLKWNDEKQGSFLGADCCLHSFSISLPIGFEYPVAGAPARRWPLIVYLHGSSGGHFFGFNKKCLGTPGMDFVANNFVVISPACSWQWKESPDAWVEELVQSLRACCWIDHNRVYLTGSSMGGMSSLEIAARNPHIYTAVLLVCGYHKAHLRDTIIERLREMPIFWWHAMKDEVCPVSLERPLWEAMAQGNPDFRLTMMPDADHFNAFTFAYCDTLECYDWMLQYALDD